MANWAPLRLAWDSFKKLFSTEMQAVDTFLTKVPNFTDGSSHTAANAVTLGGHGIEFTGEMKMKAGSTQTNESTSTTNILGACTLGATTTISGACTVSGGSSSFTVATGRTLTVASGATFSCVGTAVMNNTTIAPGKTLVVSATGHFVCGADAEFDNDITIGAVAVTQTGGGHNYESVDVHYNSGTTVSADNTVSMSDASTSIRSGTSTITGPTTVTGPTTYSGTGAFRTLRPAALAAGNHTIQPEDADTWTLSTTLGSNATWTLNDPVGNAHILVAFSIENFRVATHNLTIVDSSNNPIIIFSDSGPSTMLSASIFWGHDNRWYLYGAGDI